MVKINELVHRIAISASKFIKFRHKVKNKEKNTHMISKNYELTN